MSSSLIGSLPFFANNNNTTGELTENTVMAVPIGTDRNLTVFGGQWLSTNVVLKLYARGYRKIYDDETTLAPNTVITVGTANDDFLTLEEAFDYLEYKSCTGAVVLSINNDFTITDELQLSGKNFNFSRLQINGNNHNITINFSEPDTYTCGFKCVDCKDVMIVNANFIGGTNGTTHVLTGAYNSSQVFYHSCSFTNSYAGVIAYQGSRMITEQCTFLNLQVGVQAQQGGILQANQNTYGDTNNRCISCCDVYHAGFVIDSEANRVNFSNRARQGRNQFTENGVIITSD